MTNIMTIKTNIMTIKSNPFKINSFFPNPFFPIPFLTILRIAQVVGATLDDAILLVLAEFIALIGSSTGLAHVHLFPSKWFLTD